MAVRFHVLPVRHRADDVRLRDDADRPIALLADQDHQGARAHVLHQIRSRGHMIVLVHRRGRWPHNVRDGGRDTPRLCRRLMRSGFCHDLLRSRRSR